MMCDQSSEKPSCKIESLKSTLLLLGSFIFGYNAAMLLQELGHAAAMLITGGTIERITLRYFWSNTYYGSIPTHPVLTILAGVLLGPVFMLVLLLIIRRYRSSYMVLPIMVSVIAFVHNGIYLIIDGLAEAGNDATRLIHYGLPKPMIILLGFVMVGIGITIGLINLNVLGLAPHDSIKSRIAVFGGGMLPYLVAMVIYHWHITTIGLGLCVIYAVCGTFLILFAAILSVVMQRHFMRFQFNDVRRISWQAVLLANSLAAAVIVFEIIV